jgi:phage terminase large subunit-like protein
MAKKSRAATRAERNIAWIEGHCRIPEGRDVGKPVRLRDWQRRELTRIYDNPHGTRRAILSFGRKNGKTALAAFILLLHLCGPEAKANSQLFSAAQSRDQAAILFALAAKVVRMSPSLIEHVTIRDTAKQLECSELGTLYRALSAEASTAYGLSPVLIVHDELGQVNGPRSELYEALETATGAQESPLSIVISTQAPTDGDLLSLLIEDGLSGADPRVVVSLYTAPEELDPFSEEAIRAANPAFGDFQNATETLAMAEDARRMPAREAEYRNLILNQRVQTDAPFIAKGIWTANGAPPQDFTGRDIYGGLDLAQRNDMSALVWVADGDVVDLEPHFWLPAQDLELRAKRERVPFDLWQKQGYLHTSPGSTINYRDIAQEIMRARERWNVRSIAFDPNMAQALWPHLEDLGLSVEEQEALFWKVPQGYSGMSPCVGELEALLLDEKIRHGNHPVLTWHAQNAVLVRGRVSDMMMLAKPKGADSRRIDGMVAAAMAVGRRAMMREEKADDGSYLEAADMMVL